MSIIRRQPKTTANAARLDRAEAVARDHARRLRRLEVEVGILRPSPQIRKERPT